MQEKDRQLADYAKAHQLLQYQTEDLHKQLEQQQSRADNTQAQLMAAQREREELLAQSAQLSKSLSHMTQSIVP